MISLEKLSERAAQAYSRLKNCDLCPRLCGNDRTKGQTAICRSGENPRVYSFFLHHGEEPVISGFQGSGTIFFSRCTMRCVYCQNYQISQNGEGEEVSVEKLGMIMLSLADDGAHNLNLVTPTHFLPQILKALLYARQAGFGLPVIYNTSGYESVESLRLLEGIIDIYLVDLRYGDNKAAARYSRVKNYVEVNRAAVKEMQRQVGVLEIDKGLAVRGVIARHLILPANKSGTEAVLRFISEEISPETYISLMSQYHPVHRATEFPEINRKITFEEYSQGRKLLKKYRLENGWLQAPPVAGDSEFLGTNFKSKSLT